MNSSPAFAGEELRTSFLCLQQIPTRFPALHQPFLLLLALELLVIELGRTPLVRL